MSQGKLSFKTTKHATRQSVKNLPLSSVTNEKLETIKASDLLSSPGNKRKHVSSPESSPSVSTPPRTGHTRSKRAEKRVRTGKISHAACKTLLDYLPKEKESKKTVEKETKEDDSMISKESAVELDEATALGSEQCSVIESSLGVKSSPLVMTDKSTQDELATNAKMFLRKVAAPREEHIIERPSYKTNGGKMLAAALAKKREGVPAHKNEVLRALAARRELCVKQPPSKPPAETSSSPLETETKKAATKLSARERFSHLLHPTSPKIKPFKSITISSPTKSPAKDASKAPGLPLPEAYKHLHDKFNTSDQVVNLLSRRQETCTFQKLQKNVQEICRRRYTKEDLSHIVGAYQTAYLLAQCKGLSQIKNDRTVRNEYQLTIAFNYSETEDIKSAKTTNIFGLHPTKDTNRQLNFDDTELTANEKVDLEQTKEKHFNNLRGLITAELLERNRRFHNKLLKFVRAAHQIFLGTLVPALKIEDSKLTRWHPEFDLNNLELPPPGELPLPPVSARVLSATEMLESIDSNKSQPPPGMTEAVDKNYQKVLAERKEKQDKEKEDQLKGINPDLVARIRAKEAKKIAKNMTRNPEKDKELVMLDRLETIVRCLRVLYVSAGKGSLLLSDVTLDISSNPRINMTQPLVEEHVKLLIQISPTWLSIAHLRKKQYLKLNRNIDTNIVLDAVHSRQQQLRA